MPTPMDAMLGLVVAAIGLLTLVVAFSLADPKKAIVSYLIAAALTALGAYYFVSAEMRGFQMRRRISEIQERQNVNLEEIRKRLQETQKPTPQDQQKSPEKSPGAR